MTLTVAPKKAPARGDVVVYRGSRRNLVGQVLNVYNVDRNGRLVLGYGKGGPVAYNVRPDSVVALAVAA
jgi:hypothetical protein